MTWSAVSVVSVINIVSALLSYNSNMYYQLLLLHGLGPQDGRRHIIDYMDLDRKMGGGSPAVAVAKPTTVEARHRVGGEEFLFGEEILFGEKLRTRNCTRGKRSDADDVIITLPFTLCSENNGVEILRAMHASLSAVQSPSKMPPWPWCCR